MGIWSKKNTPFLRSAYNWHLQLLKSLKNTTKNKVLQVVSPTLIDWLWCAFVHVCLAEFTKNKKQDTFYSTDIHYLCVLVLGLPFAL